MKKHIPNAITSINVICGCIAIPFALERNWYLVLLLVLIALMADFLDGFVARLLNVSSVIGKELDSLADAITFGVLPGMVMFRLMADSACTGKCTGLLSPSFYPYLAFLIPVFSVVRLAKFNVDTEQNSNFKGLPTPITAVFFVSLPFVLSEFDVHPKILMIVVFLMSYLLVSDVKLLALKIKGFGFVDNWEKYLLVTVGVVLLALFKEKAFVIITPFYVILSLIYFYVLKK